jgi:hypothetical protein
VDDLPCALLMAMWRSARACLICAAPVACGGRGVRMGGCNAPPTEDDTERGGTPEEAIQGHAVGGCMHGGIMVHGCSPRAMWRSSVHRLAEVPATAQPRCGGRTAAWARCRPSVQ